MKDVYISDIMRHFHQSGQLDIEPLNIRRTNRLLTIFHKDIRPNGHLAMPIGNLQPVLRRTRRINIKAYNTIHTSKDCYQYSFFPRTIEYWNSLPDKIATIKEPQKIELSFNTFQLNYMMHPSPDRLTEDLTGYWRGNANQLTVERTRCHTLTPSSTSTMALSVDPDVISRRPVVRKQHGQLKDL